MSYDSHASLQSAEPAAHDLVRVWAAWRRHWPLFLLIVVLALGTAAVWIYASVPQYTAKTTMALDSRRKMVMRAKDVLPDIDMAAPVLDTQAELMRSRRVLGRAVDLLAAAGAYRQIDIQARKGAAIDALAAGLEVQRVGLSSVLELSLTADSPTFAASAVNSIAAAYIDYHVQSKQQAAHEAGRWLNQRITEVGRQVRDADTAAGRFKSDAGLLQTKGTTASERWATDQQTGLAGAQRTLTEARTQLLALTQRLQARGSGEAALLIDTPAMQGLRRRHTELANRKAQQSATLGTQHPEIIAIGQELGTLQAQIDGEAHRTVTELRNQVAVAEWRVAELQANSDRARSRLARDTRADVRLNALQAQADPARRMYENMLDRLQQISAQASLARINAVVASPATLPLRASSPNIDLVVAASVALGLGIAALITFLLDISSIARARADDLERKVRLPVVGMIPEIGRADLRNAGRRVSMNELVPAMPSSRFAEAFRRLRVTVLEGFDPRAGVVLQFTSSTFAEGKTLSSLAFAQTAAVDGRRVLLVDADVRRASLTTALGISTEAGLMEALSGNIDVSAAIVKYDTPGMPQVLPLSKYDRPSHDRFSSAAFEILLDRLRQHFDLIVIDSAPVLAVADSLALAIRVDAVVMAARWDKTPISVVLKAAEALRRVNGQLAGIMLTRVDTKRAARQVSTAQTEPVLNL